MTVAPSLRPATTDDEAFVRSLLTERMLEELAAAPLAPEARLALAELQVRAQREGHRAAFPGAESWVVEHDGLPVGRLLVDRGPDAWHVADVCLVSTGRGRGLGGEVLRGLQQDAAAADAAVTLSARRGGRAQRLYESLGFVVTGGSELDVAMRWTPDGEAP